MYKQALSTRISHFGITFDLGSRDEKKDETGLTHLLEHMFFKGTTRRSWRQILNSIEMAGGELNAFTSKEKTCVYASLMSPQTKMAIDLMADITLNSVFPEVELEKEKKVIMDEMDIYADSPEEKILDEFYERMFPGHNLGANILGDRTRLKSFKPQNLRDILSRFLSPGKMVLSYCGPLELNKIKAWCEQAFHLPETRQSIPQRVFPQSSLPFKNIQKVSNQQCHVVLGNIACSMHDERKTASMLLANMLGGPALNSLLNLSLREKNGLTYGVEAAYNYFSDTGLFYIQWTVDRVNLSKSLKMVRRALKRIMEKPFSESLLKKYKTQFIGQMIISEESNQGLMLMMGRTYLDFGEVEPLEKILAEIEAITSEQLQNLAKELFLPDKMSLLVYKPDQKNVS